MKTISKQLGWVITLCLATHWGISIGVLSAETPGQFRPLVFPNPTEKVGATGIKVQPEETLPQSRATLASPTRKPKKITKEKPILRGDQDLVLNAGWELIEAPRVKVDSAALSKAGVDTHEWYDATVPGTVLGTLVEQGVYPDPYWGLNNLSIPESLNKQDYWYRTEFAVPANFGGQELWLQFEGINYYAEIWLNGQYLGHITGAFIRGEFNVTKLVKPGVANVLAVMIAPPPNPGLPVEQSVKFGPGDNGGTMCLDGPTFVCTEGWDWIPAMRDRCSGIWQDVVLRATGPVVIGDPQVITHLPLPDISQAEVTVQTELRNVTDQGQQVILKGSFESVSFEKSISLKPREVQTIVFAPKEFSQLTVKKPRLWWPNGYGKPELYRLQLSVRSTDKKVSDQKSLHFGIREISYELAVRTGEDKIQRFEYFPTVARGSREPVIDVRREAMKWRLDGKEESPTVVAAGPAANPAALRPLKEKGEGNFLIVKVNGQRVLCRGGNWGMDDALKRISRDRLEPYVRLHRDANLTMIRNWAGQSTSEVFYDLCDEYGILVWNDFWLNTEGWNYAPIDHELFLSNVADTLKRYRNHPSIALWCPRNEGVPPEPLNMGIDRLIRELDGTRHYQPNSRLVNLRSSGPWSNQPLEKYFTELNQGFSTELGASSIPSAEVMRSFMAEADLWPTEDVWAYHDFHSKGAGDRGSVLGMISQRYGEAQNLEDLCRKAQMVNYETYRAMFEAFNSKLWQPSSGLLVWMSHPSWPSVVWQFYTWDYEPNASLFGAKKGSEPVHIQMNLPDCKVAVVNHRATPLSLKATAIVRDLSGRAEDVKTTYLSAAGSAVSEAFTLAFPKKDAHFVTLELRDKRGNLISENFYWHATDEKALQQLNALKPVTLKGKLTVKTSAGDTVITAKISNSTQTPALAVRLSLRDAKTNQRILPAYYSDNYFSLLPGESREVRIECAKGIKMVNVALDGWNVTPVSCY